MTTPLAGLHQYNGWADQFLAIPADGLEDTTLALRAPIGPGELNIVAHDFSPSLRGARYGHELDVSFGFTVAERYQLLVKLADYSADSHAVDTRKAWLMLGTSF